MTKIVLDEIRSGYNLSKINDNFKKLGDNVNDETIQKRGGSNVMEQDLDMNSNRILNILDPILGGDIANKDYVDNQDAIINEDLNALEDKFDALLGGVGIPGNGTFVTKVVTLTAGQTTVTFPDINTRYSSIYINGAGVDNGRLVYKDENGAIVDYDFVPLDEHTITLTNSYPAGTIVSASMADVATDISVAIDDRFDAVDVEINTKSPKPFDTIGDVLVGGPFVVGERVEWMGYHTKSDGGSNWGVVKTGAHTEDGGSIFSIDANTYVEANLKGKTINAKKFGFIGNGISDDAPSINNGLSYIHNNGGGTLKVPHTGSTVNLGGILYMGKNTTLLSERGVRYKKSHGATFLRNSLGYTSSSDIPAYGGNGDIAIIGGIWDGWAGGVDAAFTHFVIGYATNVLVKDVELLDNIDAHHVDMASCRNVTFERCKFLGQKIVNKSAFTFDMLQIDCNDATSFPYFGTAKEGHCKDITIKGCKFGPNPDSADPAFNNAYVGIGSHLAVYNEWADGIRILNCDFVDMSYAGVYNWKWNNVLIDNCRFIRGNDQYKQWATTVGSQSNKDRSGIDGGAPQAGKGLKITNTSFEYATGNCIQLNAIADIELYPETSRHSDIDISNISVEGSSSYGVFLNDCIDASVHVARGETTGSSNVYVLNSKNVSVDVSVSKNSLRAIRVQGSDNCTAKCDVGESITGDSLINVDGSTNTEVEWGTLKNANERAVLITNDSVGGVLRGGLSVDTGLTNANSRVVDIQTGSHDWHVDGLMAKYTGAGPGTWVVQVTGTCDNVSVANVRSTEGASLVSNASPGGLTTAAYGSGSPEGVIKAPVGSDYRDTTGGKMYVKESGNNDTGWVVK